MNCFDAGWIGIEILVWSIPPLQDSAWWLAFVSFTRVLRLLRLRHVYASLALSPKLQTGVQDRRETGLPLELSPSESLTPNGSLKAVSPRLSLFHCVSLPSFPIVSFYPAFLGSSLINSNFTFSHNTLENSSVWRYKFEAWTVMQSSYLQPRQLNAFLA